MGREVDGAEEVPEAWGPGKIFAGMGARGVLFEAGTLGLVWIMVKPDPFGPDG